MRIAEEPFLTRENILAVLKPGGTATDRPFRTLRKHAAASEGITIPVRTTGGHLLGKVSLYNSLNQDAARAFRLDQVEVAQELVSRAGELEKSVWAEQIRLAVEAIANAMPTDPAGSDSPPALRNYLTLRAHSSWRGLEQAALAREWIAYSKAWLDAGMGDRQQLAEAVEALDREAKKIRAEVVPNAADSVSTFLGIVRRMDPVAAELESEYGEVLLIPREDLDRQGLALVGQSVSLLREVLPNGGVYCLPMPAVTLKEPQYPEQRSPWDDSIEPTSIPLSALVSERDSDWLDRELAREPTAIPAGPLRRS